jgi:hypothetical protein
VADRADQAGQAVCTAGKIKQDGAAIADTEAQTLCCEIFCEIFGRAFCPNPESDGLNVRQANTVSFDLMAFLR